MKILSHEFLDESSLDFQFESDRNMMIDLQETFLFSKVKLNEGNVTLEAADDVILSPILQCTLFSNCEVYFNNEQVYTSNGFCALKAFINCLIRKGPWVLFAHIKVIRTRKNRHRLETNPSSLVKQRKLRKFAYMRSYPLMFSLAVTSYSPTSKFAYDCFAPDQICTSSPIGTKNSDVPFSKRLSFHNKL